MQITDILLAAKNNAVVQNCKKYIADPWFCPILNNLSHIFSYVLWNLSFPTTVCPREQYEKPEYSGPLSVIIPSTSNTIISAKARKYNIAREESGWWTVV